MSVCSNFVSKSVNLTKFLLILALFVFALLVVDLLVGPSMSCSTDYEYQKSRVVEHIEKKGWPVEFLAPIENPDGGCEAMFLYKSEMHHIQFTVAGGYKVTWWDFNERSD